MQQTPQKQQLFLLAFVGLIFMLGLAFTFNREQFIRYKSDFFQRWYATTKLLEAGRNLYDDQNGAEALQIVYGDGVKPFDETNFYYPAHLLLFIMPLAAIPYQPAHFIWTVLVQIFIVIGLTAVMRTWHWPDKVLPISLYLIAVILSVPYFQHTIWGQFNSIGIMGLGLSLAALARKRYGWGGIWAVALTFKPHTTIITLAFLLLWSLFQRERWRFLLGFTLTGLVCWGVAELAQPGWVWDFVQAVKGYTAVINKASGQNDFGKQAAVLSSIIAAFALFWKQRRASVPSPAFAGCLALSAGISSLAIPIIGMFHVLIFPLILIPLLASYQAYRSRWYRPALVSFIAIYFLGWLGFLGGFLAAPGMHIIWSETINKILLPLLVIGWALPLCFVSRPRHLPE